MSDDTSSRNSRKLMSLDRRQFSVGAAATVAAASVPAIVRAQDATPDMVEPDMATPVASPVSEVQLEVLVSGLLDPRYIAIDGDTIYFTEAGNGGDTEVFETPGDGTPTPDSPISMMGYTGKLSSMSADGTVTEIVTDFISYTFGGNGEMVGAGGVALDGAGKAYVAVGSPGPFVGSMELTGDEGALFEVELATGEKRVVADLVGYEIANDPDPMAIDSNVYGVELREGVAYVTDAGGNSILAVDIASGEVSTFAVTGGVDGPFPNPMRGGEMQIDSVPAGIVLGPDDRLYVSYVTGGPFPPGASPVHAFTIAGEQATIATGLTMVTDLAFGSDGHLYACVMSTDTINNGPGQIVRVMADGNHMVVVDGLALPNGMAFDAEDNLIITHMSSFGMPGEIVRISGVTTAAGTPFVVPAPPA